MENRSLAAYVAISAATYAIDKPYEYLIPEELVNHISVGVRVRVGFGKGNRKVDGIVLGIHEKKDEGFSLKPILETIDETPVFDENLLKLALWLRDRCFCTLFDVAYTMLPSGVWNKFDVQYAPHSEKSCEEATAAVSSVDGGCEVANYIFASKKPAKRKDLEQLFDTNTVKKTIDILLKNNYISASDYAVKNISDKTERLVRISVSKEDIEKYIQKKHPKETVCRTLELLFDMGATSVKELCYFTGISRSQLNTLNKNGIVSYENIEVYRRPLPKFCDERREIKLNKKQQEIYDSIAADVGKGPTCSLLHGVTGSGKTLVYFKLIEKVIVQGKKAILLVPEISLTPQLLEQVYAYFGERTAIMHSALSSGERYDEWKRMKNGEVDVVVGTRSAVFSPLSDIGIIILDEEQDDSYKSSSNPRYHARDAAKFRCVSENALLLLGSATPSVESMYNAKNGKYKLHTIETRFNERPLPQVIVSDLRKAVRDGNSGIISPTLFEEIEKNLKDGRQSILFLNRRGASKYVVCDACGEVPGCPNCSVPLVYHSKNGRLMCHHCGFSKPLFDACDACGGNLKNVGFGTQKVEEELLQRFPSIGIVRMDMDTTSAKASHEQLLAEFRDKRIPVLLGTQMITKGLDFENVTLVGVLAADQALFSDNYKAAENTFSLITQVVGRAGRGEKEGRAIIQTYSPNSALISAAARQNYNEFYDTEIKVRETRHLPPFCDLFSLVVVAENELDALSAATKLSQKAKAVIEKEYSELSIRVLGPSPASIVKLHGKFRYKLTLCMENTKRARDLVSRLSRDFLTDKTNKKLSIIIDVNSTDF